MKTCPHGVRPKKGCAECRREKDRRCRAANLDAYRERDRLRAPARRVPSRLYRNVWRYGLPPERFFALILDQQSACAICGADFTALGGIRVDHDHATGRVRGLLCSPCNTGLGQFHDDPGTLRTAAEYLERTK